MLKKEPLVKARFWQRESPTILKNSFWFAELSRKEEDSPGIILTQFTCVPPEALRSPHPDVPIVFDQEEVKGYLWTIADQEEEISSLKLQVEALQQKLEENGNTR